MLTDAVISRLILNPDYVAIFVIGAVAAVSVILIFAFRGYAEIVEAFYDSRARCATAREKFRRVSNQRQNAEGAD